MRSRWGLSQPKDEGGGCDGRATTMSQDDVAGQAGYATGRPGLFVHAADRGPRHRARGAAGCRCRARRGHGRGPGPTRGRQAQLQWGSETGCGWNLRKATCHAPSCNEQETRHTTSPQGGGSAPPTPRLRVQHNSLVSVRHDSEVHAAALWWELKKQLQQRCATSSGLPSQHNTGSCPRPSRKP